MESPGTVRERETVARDLPLAVDLLVACTLAGQPVDRAFTVVAQAIGGPLSRRLDALLARISLGADPLTEWGALVEDAQFGALARTMVRALKSGAPLASGLSRLAEDSRRDRRSVSQAWARSVGVKAAGPLAACFLPAFMLIGVVPTVAGAFTSLAGS
jgi:pilus assembly protein TadC